MRQVQADTASAPAHLFAPRPTVRYRVYNRGNGRQTAGFANYKMTGPVTVAYKPVEIATGAKVEEFLDAGKNPPDGAIVHYSLRAEPDNDGEVTLTILDKGGKVVREYSSKAEEPPKPPTLAGANRFVWDLRYEGATKVPHAPLWGGNTDGPEALPGAYQVRLTVLGKSYTAPLEIKADPRLKIGQEDLTKQFDLLLKIRDKVTETDDTIIQIRDLREQIHTINKRLKSDPRAKAIADAGKRLDTEMTEVEEALIQTKAKSGQDVLNFPVRLNNHLVALSGVVGSADSAPTKQSYEVFDMLRKAVDEQLAKWKAIVSTAVAAYNNLVKQQEVPALMLTQPEAGK
ncbi:MAG: hypothetical protein DMG53_24675 [Acidobacteria bacterium]|nr:MAG: hypothetical protein DMG53_24675 [Acidobacteriota bacterium]